MNMIKVKNDSDIPENFTGMIEWENGTKEWLKYGQLHREDGPAAIYPNEIKLWYKNGLFHREDGPACEYPNGDKSWYKEGNLHREDGPAVEYADGEKKWYKEGKKHRKDGPACEYSDEYKEWYLENKIYRQISLKDYIILDSYQGEYGLLWYKLLNKDQIIKYPDILGLITK